MRPSPHLIPPRAQRLGKNTSTLCALVAGLLIAISTSSIARAQLFTNNQSVFGGPRQSQWFGQHVAVSGDTLVASTGPNKDIYVYVRSATGWTLQQHFTANYSQYSDGYVAIDGDTLVAVSEIYVRSNGVWTLQQSLPFNDPRPALQGDILAVGLPQSLDGHNGDGAVYVYTRSGTTWTQQAQLHPDSSGTQEQLGVSVKLDGDTLVATPTTDNGINGNGGAGGGGAYVFTRSGTTWTRQARLPLPSANSWMGVSIQGNTIAQSDPARNVIYLYDRTGTTWTNTATIPLPATGGDAFGNEVALSGTLLAATADGISYLFSRIGSSWVRAQTITRNNSFASVISLTSNGKTFVIGNFLDSTQASASGAVDAYWVLPPPAPGSGWHDDDVGPVGAAGSSADNNGTVTVRGSGADIWDRADQFHFRSQSLTGDGAIVARVTSTGGGNAWAKAGLMFREDLAPAARTALVLLATGGHFGTQVRADTYDTTNFLDAGWSGPPQWMMLARAGNTFASYRSADGASWTLIGSATIVMPATVFVGLAVTSHDNATLNAATFDGVEVVPTGTSPPDRPNPPSNLTGNLVTGTSVHLQWTDNSSNETSFVVERGIGTSATQFLATVPANVTEYTDSGLANGTTYTYQVRAAGSSNGHTVTSAASNSVTLTTASSGDSLTGSQLGSADVAGSFSTSGGTISIDAAGADIWGNSDSGYFVNRSLTGDFDLRANVTAFSNLHPWSKIGVMVRESLAADARNVFTLLTAGNACGMQVRDTAGAATNFTAGPWVNAPYWVRLVRTGNTFQSFVSADGTNWQAIGTATVALPATLSAGIAMSSHVANTTAHATVTSLTFTSSAPP